MSFLLKTLLLVTLILSAGSYEIHASKPEVVTTVAPIADMVREVGGESIELHPLVPQGVNSHTFEPSPSHARILAGADLILVNGLFLEISLIKLAGKVKKPTTPLLSLADRTISREEWLFDFSFPAEEGKPNPHLWLNLAHAIKYVSLIEEALVDLDPPKRDYYEKRAAIFSEKLERLDRLFLRCSSTIPLKRRRLLTYHDSFAYFAPRYGFQVIGALQPSDFSEPSPREVARLIKQIKKERVPAIFGSELFPSRMLEQIARESGATMVATLRDDALPGEPGDKEHTFIGMMVRNMKTIVEVLGGDQKCFKGSGEAG